jgi:hypothetical protein
MAPISTKHPFDEWFERNYRDGASPEKRRDVLTAWNAVIDAAMNAAVQMRDGFVIAGAYEYAGLARDVAEMIGASGFPPKQLPGALPARFPPK